MSIVFLNTAYLEQHLQNQSLGWPIIYRQRVTSTQDIAREAALAGAPEGLLVLADEQTAGRGRAGRSWWAPPGTSILSSVLLRPPLPPERTGYIGMIAGLAMSDALADVAGVNVALKWPNDLLLHGRKLGGILIESLWEGLHLEAVILGLGLNVTVRFPPESPLYGQAISLLEAGAEVEREPIIVAYMRRLAEYYARVRAGWVPTRAWAERLDTLGKPVRVVEHEATWDGFAVDVTLTGELVVQVGDERRIVRAGDVHVRTVGDK